MTRATLLFNSFRHHWRAHLGAILASAIGSAVLVGALLVGDSVRYSLLTMATERLGAIQVALLGQDRFFRQDLARSLYEKGTDMEGVQFHDCQPMLQLPGVCASDVNQLRANDAQICGVLPDFGRYGDRLGNEKFFTELATGEALLNAKLARLLNAKVGDSIRARIYKPGLLPHDAPLGARDDQAAFLRVKVKAILPEHGIGRFSLLGNQVEPPNLFVPLKDLQETIEQKDRTNLLFFMKTPGKADCIAPLKIAADLLSSAWSLDDAQLKLRHDDKLNYSELSTPRVFLDDVLTDTLLKQPGANGLTTYFINAIRANGKETPYSMITAASAPLVDPDMKDDEIILNTWIAEDLNAKPGDSVEIEYYAVGLMRKLETRKATFKVKSIAPIEGLRADRHLMPDFPGIAEVDSTHDWNAGVPIDMKKIRPKDEDYWKKYRGTPKAFITLKRGIELWKNRFGTYTAIRFPLETTGKLANTILKDAQPERLGMLLLPVKEQALKAVDESMDFGGLFLGLSFFLIIAALLLMALIFQFGVESRTREIGVLLALGFNTKQVRNQLWAEGLIMAALGILPGAFGGILYAKYLIHALGSQWQGAVGGAKLLFHAEPLSILIGCVSALIASALAIFFTVRKLAKRPARELLASQISEPTSNTRLSLFWKIIAVLSVLGAMYMLMAGFKSRGDSAAGMFFGSGSLLLIAALIFVRWLLIEPVASHATAAPAIIMLGIRAARRKPGRSLAAAALLASGAFLVCAIGVNEVDASTDASEKSSGTGGYALFARATIPLFDDLNTKVGREKASLPDEGLEHTTIYPLRVKSGDEASCLNLNKAQRPRILGVPAAFRQRGGFSFTETLAPIPANANPWTTLLPGKTNPGAPIPAIADSQSMQWAMHLSLADELAVQDESGQTRRIKLVGALNSSTLQGNVLISEEDFLSLYPSESGYRYFMIEAPAKDANSVALQLAKALEDNGFEAQTSVSRLNEYNAVQNTYLSTFQALGALGMLLGSLGLGIVVLRNMLERRSELAVLRALGFSKSALLKMILAEHLWILLLGLAVGSIAALCAIAPTLRVSGAPFPWKTVSFTLLGILTCGFVSALLAAWATLRAPLIEALKSEY